jgi:proline dehydrogenase
MSIINSAIVKLITLVPKKIVRVFANKYIAGDKLINAIETAKRLNDKGIMGTMDVLGEDTSNKEEAVQARRECIEVLEAIDKNNLDSNLSLKLTQLGLKLDFEFCLENLLEIFMVAKECKQFVRIDMEDSTCTDDTLRIYERAKQFYPRCGVVIQSYMRRSYNDVEKLVKNGTNIRLCKGIYVEPEEIAYKKKDEVNNNFLKLLRLMLSNGSYTGIATHDEKLVYGAYEILDELKKKKDEYEFQMLLGIRENLRDEILKAGHRLRVYIPFGEHWYRYCMRRFKENPKMASYVVKSILTRN